MISTLKTEAQFALVKWLNLFSLGLMKGVEEIEVRPFSGREEYELMLDYFYKADDSFLRGMGVDRSKLRERDKWLDALLADHERPDSERNRFYLDWIFRGRRAGHSSINKIVIGIEAFMHLHLWDHDCDEQASELNLCAGRPTFTSSDSI